MPARSVQTATREDDMMADTREPAPGDEVIAEVTQAASRLGVPFTPEQIEYVAGCVAALRVSATRVRRQQRNDEPAFGYRSPPSPCKED